GAHWYVISPGGFSITAAASSVGGTVY
ncbi:MAG: hypothetical protein QOH08_2005, partial [Chloroflexota bacterium]|nr:hypothetical protein [Chloroflexota bacterium]